MTTHKRTPLYDAHIAAGARMVPFAGFDMPVSYAGLIEEHTTVRERVGLFDVSHMGEFTVSGPDTWKYLDHVVTNDCSKLPPDGVLYTVMCRDDGTVVDDLLVARMGEDRALIVVNASNIDKDWDHMKWAASTFPRERLELHNESDDWALIAVQGPKTRDLMKVTPMLAPLRDAIDDVAYYRWRTFGTGREQMIASRTGYTGELGFEVFVRPEHARELWDQLLDAGKPFGVAPAGLGARDTLRFEACLCLYGHELDDETSPLEAGLNWLVKLGKSEFIGRDALVHAKETGLKKKLLGFELDGRNLARQGYAIMRGDAMVGKVTSGTYGPTLKKSLCLAYVDADSVDADLCVQVRAHSVPAKRVPIPFYPSRARA
ncbi:MAG TPA: glycine cleavage system aminomethyltransferase GcvT [Candidatus Krumholzibacteria bacterium]|nr:glycine cleavage system aminomethyltransferase GcvT [Candidatus Krumholzibacteria bacterium]